MSDEILLWFFETLKLSKGDGLNQNDEFLVLRHTAPNKKAQEYVKQYVTNIRAGKKINETLSGMGVPTSMTAMVRLGEEGGTLVDVLSSLIDLVNRRVEGHKMIKKMLGQPRINFFLTVGVFILFVSYLMPTFMENIEFDLNKLPDSSRVLYELAGYVSNNDYTYYFVAITAILSILLWKAILFIGGFVAPYLPMINQIKANQDKAIFFSMMAVSKDAGVINKNALRFAALGVENKKLAQQLRVASRLSEEGGNDLTTAIKRAGAFDELTHTYIRLSDEGSESVKSYKRYATRSFENMTQYVEKSSQMISPIMLMLPGGTIMFLYMSIMSITSAVM